MSGPFSNIPQKVCCPIGYYGRQCEKQQYEWEQYSTNGAVINIDIGDGNKIYGLGKDNNIYRADQVFTIFHCIYLQIQERTVIFIIWTIIFMLYVMMMMVFINIASTHCLIHHLQRSQSDRLQSL